MQFLGSARSAPKLWSAGKWGWLTGKRRLYPRALARVSAMAGVISPIIELEMTATMNLYNLSL